MSQFRKIPTNGLPYGIFESPLNPIVTIPANGQVEYTNVLEEKQQKIRELREDPTAFRILFVWGGKGKTDVFEILPDDLVKFS